MGWGVPMQAVGYVTCLMLETGGTSAEVALCNAMQPSQRWRRAAPQATWQDSRLESALNPGVCLTLQADAAGNVTYIVASCSTPDKVSPLQGAPAVVCNPSTRNHMYQTVQRRRNCFHCCQKLFFSDRVCLHVEGCILEQHKQSGILISEHL